MLRGQGSLKELLGQSVVASSYARKKRLKAEADAAAAATAQPTASKRAKPSSSRSAPAGTDAAANAAAKLFAKAKSAVKAEQQQTSDLTRVRSDPPDLATPRNLHASLRNAAPGTSTPATVPKDATALGGRLDSVGGTSDPGDPPVCCPLCSRTLSGSSDSAINSHIDHCLARSASTKKIKQRTVTALFGSASAAAAQRCKAMLQHKHVQQQAAPRSISAPPALQETRRQQQQLEQQPSQDTGITTSQQAEQDIHLPALQQEADKPQEEDFAFARPAAPSGDATPAAQGPAASGAMLDLLDQATQPLDALLQLRQHQMATVHAAGNSVDLASALSPDMPNLAAAATAGASLPGTPPVSAVAMDISGVATAQAADAAAAAAPAAGSDDEPGMHTPQRQIISRQAVLPCASPLATVKSFTTCVVGRRFQTEAECADGEPVTIQHEPSNTRDRNALLVLGSRNQVLGHLAAEVAKWLGPLVIGNMVEAAGTVQDEPATPSSPITISIQIGFSDDMLLLSPRKQKRLHISLKRAGDAAADALRRQGRRLGPGGAGECLRANFRLVTDTVRGCDGHLLSDDEHAMLDSFHVLPQPAQCLFLRLYQRRGPWFRQHALEYPEVGDAAPAVEQLSASGFLAAATAGDTAELIQMLTVPELKALAVGMDLKLGSRNSSNRQAMLAWYSRTLLSPAPGSTEAAVEPQALAAHMEALVGPCCRLTAAAATLMGRVRRLFFMSEHQDLSRFLVTNLGITKYPQYRLNRPSSGFQKRQDMLEYEEALQHAAVLDAAFEAGDMAAAAAALAPAWAAIRDGRHKAAAFAIGPAATAQPFLRCYSAAWVYATMATAGVSLLEKQRKYQEATEYLHRLLGGVCCAGRRGEWWTRLSIDTEHMGRVEEALELAEAALADEWVKTGDRMALQRRVLRLGKPPRRWRRPPWAATALWEPPQVTIVAKPLANVIGLKSKFVGASGDQVTVEQLALEYYATPDGGGWQGMHSEGGVWATLWGLLMWPVLFADVPEVFRTPFQSAPLDLGTDAFFPAREALIMSRLKEIREGRALDILRDTWAAHEGTVCRGINWERQPLEELAAIADCVGGAGLAALCHLLAQDHSGWGGGMPDLLLWRPSDRRAKLSEVKGPRDRLSEQQRAWAAALSGAGLQVEVLKVVETLPSKGR